MAARTGNCAGRALLWWKNLGYRIALNSKVRCALDLTDGTGQPVFRHVAGPGLGEMQMLVEQIASRICRVLEQRGLVERDIENAWLAGDGEGGPLDDLLGHSITYRIAVLAREPGRSCSPWRYALKTPYREGTTHIVSEPLDLRVAHMFAADDPTRGVIRSQVALARQRHGNLGGSTLSPVQTLDLP